MKFSDIRRLLKPASRYGLVWLFLSTAVMHFVRPMPFVRIVPPYFRHALTLVYITGTAEIIGAAGLLVPRSRRLAGGGLIVVLAAVFPANINMALHPEQFRDIATAGFFWLRLPLQLVYIAWAAWCWRSLTPAPARLKDHNVD